MKKPLVSAPTKARYKRPIRFPKDPRRYYSCILSKNQGRMPQAKAPLYGFPDNGAFALIARSLPPPPIFAGRGETCFASASAPIQLPTVSSGQIRKRVRICRRCARMRMSAAGLSWTHPIRPFGGVRCFYAGGCGSLAGETARNRAADQIRQRCRICRFRPVSPWGKNLARMGPCGLAAYGPKHSCPGGGVGRRPARARTRTRVRPRLRAIMQSYRV